MNDSVCYISDHHIASISSLRTFCAGGENYGPCHGDSGWLQAMLSNFSLSYFTIFLGGGFFVKVGSIWTLGGIVSASVLKDNFDCNVERYTIYTKVVEFNEWIKAEVERND